MNWSRFAGICLLLALSTRLMADDIDIKQPDQTIACKIPSQGRIAPSSAVLNLFTQEINMDCRGTQPGESLYPVPIKFFFKKNINLKGILFTPVVIGGELEMLTPQAEWITDTCAMGLLVVVPKCTENTSHINLLIHSGSVGDTLTINMIR